MPLPASTHFLDWATPLAQAAADFLFGEHSITDSVIDFTGHVIVVPTRESGRRLHAELAQLAGVQNKGILSPTILTPDACLRLLAPAQKIASDSVSRLTLASVLRDIEPADFPALFPAEPPLRDWPWAINLAETLLSVRKTLGNSIAFPDFASVSEHPDNEEPLRWQELSRIEHEYRRRLADQGMADEEDIRHSSAHIPVIPAAWKKLWLIGTPDPTPLLLEALEQAQDLEVRVAIAAPETLRDGFDKWGRVVSDFWIQRPTQWNNFDAQVRLADTPESLGTSIRETLPIDKNPGNWTTVGLLDPSLAPAITQAIESTGASAYNPAGELTSRHELGILLRLWADFLAGEETETIPNLLRFPLFNKILFHPDDTDRVLTEWDSLRERHLPDTLRNMQEFVGKHSRFSLIQAALEKIAHWRSRFNNTDWHDALRNWLEEIFAGRILDNVSANDRKMQSVLESVLAEVDHLAAASIRQSSLKPADWLGLVVQSLASKRIPNDPDDSAVPMLGWLELLWEDAPHLALAGLNEGIVPETITADPFLPGSFRDKLGLPTNDMRLAQAAYVLQKLLAQRGNNTGRVDALVLQADMQGEPLRPSRLLFLCPTGELPARVKRLFAEPVTPKPSPPWQAGWKFLPPVEEESLKRITADIAVTRLAAYLDCPFRFYLGHVLRMEEGDPWKSEPDAREFGSALHAALENFARDEDIRDETDAETIEKFTVSQLHLYLRNNYGQNWPLPVIIMAESAKNRLTAFAREQSRLRNEGWQIHDAEKTFAEILDAPLRFSDGGTIVNGKIDRIDFHPEQGWRIIDYKTSAKAVCPQEAHIISHRDDDIWPPDYARVEFARRDKTVGGHWINLQLPLYRYLFRKARDIAFNQVQVAYFNLPKATGETSVALWSDYTQAMEESAVICVKGILDDIAGRRFWPPNPRVRFDNFEKLLQPAPESVVDAAGFLAALEEHR
ncbi:MAG: PD-(D/E)XK nuclease family protein [Puniceicoccales bacterium]|jgi:ATP-dependent helicase/nuclease subunit B|nr:PD-(D/E)XK nuclease family protein [Puniceicoccales bacterium]